MIEALLAALKAEFTQDVQFHANYPANMTAPSVIVTPGDPFLEPSTHGLVKEAWDILVVFNTTAPDRNVAQMRENSLRIRRAVSKVGGLWEQTSSPRKASAEQSDTKALVINSVSFRHEPNLS